MKFTNLVRRSDDHHSGWWRRLRFSGCSTAESGPFKAWLMALSLVIMAALAAGSALAADKTPLLMEGKKTLYQRIITHPGATFYPHPDGQAGEQTTPFTVMYVYDRQKSGGGKDWLQLAANSGGRDLAWMPAEQVSEWKQSLVLLFADRVGRAPLLFFKTQQALTAVAGEPGIGAAMEALARTFQDCLRNQIPPPDSLPILAMEPPDEEGAVSYDHFYLMPIFAYKEPFEGVKFLEVGSIDPGSPPPAGDDPKSGAGFTPDAPNSAIAFVIDTTVSMRPYIEKTQEVARRVYDEATKGGQADNVALGLVAFRSSVEATPRLEYNTKVISPLRTAINRAEFEKALAQVKEARVSTHNFNEDSMAGVKTAVEELDWEPYVGRIIILVTDAGPLEITDPYLSTMMTNREIADLARDKNIKIITIHVKSPSGKKNHVYAEGVYRGLSTSLGGDPAYLPVEAATAETRAANFAKVNGELITSMASVLFGLEQGGKSPDEAPQSDDPEMNAKAMGALLGYSIKLDYLGRTNTSNAPTVVRSWIADKDLGRLDSGQGANRREVPTVQVAVLLTKDQLSALSRQIKLIIDKAEENIAIGGRDFFESILSASTQMVRSPGGSPTVSLDDNLVKLGVLGEFLEDLPYKSEIMTMTERDWYAMNIGQQSEFVHRLKSRLARYEEYDKDVRNWGKFDKDYPGDWLYRVPLTMLP